MINTGGQEATEEIAPENLAQTMLESPEMKTEIEKMNEALRARQENDVRIAVIGNVDSGKSTLVGCMTKCVKDDGRGSARKMVFNFSHEAANGRTSSIGQEIMGFDKDHKQVELERQNPNKNQSWAHVANNSESMITFLDLCGHEKYLKTTMFGLVGLMPDYAMIVVGANMGVSRMTKEHLGIVLALKIPIFIVITKIDIAPKPVYEETVKTLKKILNGPYAAKKAIVIREEDNDMAVYAKGITSNVCPIFSISNVTGEGTDQLKIFMSQVKSRIYQSTLFGKPDEPVEFLIDGIY